MPGQSWMMLREIRSDAPQILVGLGPDSFCIVADLDESPPDLAVIGPNSAELVQTCSMSGFTRPRMLGVLAGVGTMLTELGRMSGHSGPIRTTQSRVRTTQARVRPRPGIVGRPCRGAPRRVASLVDWSDDRPTCRGGPTDLVRMQGASPQGSL